MVSGQPKLLPCFFGLGVLCSYRRSEKSGMMDCCLICRHYLDFLRAMEEAEIEFWDEVEEMREAEIGGYAFMQGCS